MVSLFLTENLKQVPLRKSYIINLSPGLSLLLYNIFLTELAFNSPLGTNSPPFTVPFWKSEADSIWPVLPISSEEILRSGLGKHPIYDLLVSGLYETM